MLAFRFLVENTCSSMERIGTMQLQVQRWLRNLRTKTPHFWTLPLHNPMEAGKCRIHRSFSASQAHSGKEEDVGQLHAWLYPSIRLQIEFGGAAWVWNTMHPSLHIDALKKRDNRPRKWGCVLQLPGGQGHPLNSTTDFETVREASATSVLAVYFLFLSLSLSLWLLLSSLLWLWLWGLWWLLSALSSLFLFILFIALGILGKLPAKVKQKLCYVAYDPEAEKKLVT